LLISEWPVRVKMKELSRVSSVRTFLDFHKFNRLSERKCWWIDHPPKWIQKIGRRKQFCKHDSCLKHSKLKMNISRRSSIFWIKSENHSAKSVRLNLNWVSGQDYICIIHQQS
jgi:hypothetical protein